ncbi:MAG TPA: hypothetical protein VKT18_09695, partial [Acidimicrobiales bacterium]|nr:hypothetical protein [Acidimicrobiales bacterium]
ARRHDELAREMVRRGYRHDSPLLADFDEAAAPGVVDERASLRELASRCEECRGLQSARRAESRRSRGTASPTTRTPSPGALPASGPSRGSRGSRAAR